jgi:hypothetical protein
MNEKLFRAIATTVVPEAQQLGEAEWREVHGIIDHALSRRPAAIRRQLAMLLRVINGYALVRCGRGLSALSQERRYRVLHELERSPIPLLRKGVWGLRTLILMGYYARPAAASAIGYGAHLRGWSALRGGEAKA